jgi:hypothetical protein
MLALEDRLHSTMLPDTETVRASLANELHDPATAILYGERAIAAMELAGGKDSGELWRPLIAVGLAKVAKDPAGARVALERAIAIGERIKVRAADLAPARAALAKLGRT